MVSVQQFEQQVRARAQAIRSKQQEVRRFRETPKFSQQELRGMQRGREQRKLTALDRRGLRRQVVEVRKEAKRRAQEQVTIALGQQKELESTLGRAKEAENVVQRLKADITAARKVARTKGATPAALGTKRQREIFVQEQKIIQAEKDFKQFQSQLKEVSPSTIEGITLPSKEPSRAVRKVGEVVTGAIQKVGRVAGTILGPIIDAPIPTGGIDPVRIIRGQKPKTTTLARVSSQFITAKTAIGEGSAEATTAGARALGLPLEFKAPSRRLFPGSPLFPGGTGPERTFITLPGLIPKIARAAPEILTFATVPGAIAGVGTEAVVGTKQRKELDKTFERELTRITQEAQRQPVEEGFRAPTRAEVKTQVGSQLRESIRSQVELGIGTAIVFGGALGAARGVRALRKPIVTRTGGQIIPTATDITAARVQIITPKGPIPFQTVQTRVLRGPVIETRTSRVRQILGFGPTERIVSPAKLNIAQTPLGQFGQQPFILEQFKVLKSGQPGKSQFSLVTSQGQVQLTAEQVSKAGKIPQFLQQKLAEARTGTPVPRELASKLFGEQDIFGVSSTQAQRFGAPLGKTISRQLGVARERVVQTLPSGIKLFKLDVTAKDVTRPFARATGQPRVLRGTGIQFKSIDLTARGGLPPGITSIGPSGGPTTPLSRTFGPQPQVVQTIQAIPIPKLPTPKITRGPTGVVRETRVGPIVTELAPVTRQAVIIRDPIPKQADAISLGLSQATGVTQAQRPRQVVRQRQVQEIAQAQIPIQVPIVGQVPVQQPGQVIRQRQIQRQIQIPAFQRPRRQVSTLLQTFGVRRAPITRTPLLSSTGTGAGLLGGAGVGIGELVDVFVRRRKKDRRIADDVPFNEAKRILRTRLISTLAASGFIQKNSGQRVFVNLGQGFRPAKNEPLRVVQRRGFRLGTRSEVGEIKTAKRRSVFFK